MAVNISGKLIGPNGDPRAGVTIQLRAVKTSSAVLQLAPSTTITGSDGSYSLSVEVGTHEVMIDAYGQPYEKVGTITVYADSVSGSLNDFLTVPGDTELTPTIVATVETMRLTAQAAASDAIAARDAAQGYASHAEAVSDGGATYASDAAGLAATTSGQYFRVPQGIGASSSFKYYLNNAGTALAVADAVGKAAVDAVAQDVESLSGTLNSISGEIVKRDNVANKYIPIAESSNGDVAIWLINGLLGAMGLAPELVDDILESLENSDFLANLAENVDSVTTRLPDHSVSSDYIPIAEDNAGNVALWLSKGYLGAMGLSSDLISSIASQLASSTQSLIDASAPEYTYTNGQSLYSWRANKSKIKLAASAKASILFTGDSWTQKTPIPQSMCNLLYPEYGKYGEGYIQLALNDSGFLNNMGVIRAGTWTLYDASVDTAAPTYGCGLDGQAITSTDAVSSVTVANVLCTTFIIYYYDGDGTFTYSVDNGSATTIACGGTNTVAKVTVTLAASTTLHKFVVATTGNTGAVTIYGFRSSNLTTGVEINKCGNSSITSVQYGKVLPFIDYFAQEINPDVIFIILSTNDYRTNVTVTDFYSAMTALVMKYKSVCPNAGIVLVAPAQTSATSNVPLSEFVKVIKQVAKENSVEYYSLFKRFPSSWATGNAYGLFADSLHLSATGADFLVRELINKFL